MKLLIVTPTLGNSPWLSDTMRSVADLGAMHVLVAPKGQVASLAARFPGVKVVGEPEGGGMYSAINYAVEVEGREWDAVSYLNDDDLLLPDFARVCAVVERDPSGARVVYGRVRLINAQGARLGAIPISPSGSINRALYAARLEPLYQQGTVLTRDAWNRLGGCDGRLRFCGDSDLLARACLAGMPFERVGGEVAAFRLRAGQLTKNRAAMVAERALVDERLGLLKGVDSKEKRRARLWFRWANAWVYAERIARHGWVSFDELLTRGGTQP